MLKSLKNRKAQMVATEYVLTMFVILAILGSMTMYFRRLIQGRIRDANNSVLVIVRNRVGNYYAGNDIYVQYEPYYRNQISGIIRLANTVDRVSGSFPLTSGIFTKSYNDLTDAGTVSYTAPPINAD